MAFDAHIHLYPPEVCSNPTSWAEARCESYWSSCVAPSEGPQLQAWANIDRLLVDMDAAGVERCAVLGWYWENQDTCRENIRWQIEWVRQHPDRLIAYAPFNARGRGRALDDLKYAFDNGISGIGELNPPAQGYAYDDPFLFKAIELAEKYGNPINFHVTDPKSRDYPGKIATPFESLLAIAVEHPNASIIFAHLGGMMHLEKLQNLSNVFLDTAAVPLLYSSEIYGKAIDRIGVDRILFGTDYPLRTFPKRQRGPSFALHLESIGQSGLRPDELQRILSENFKRLHP